ncbi:DEAD/DEAH box helicase, partial [bacterium]|nr:DEAD/DEAH box helicase [bacterium]
MVSSFDDLQLIPEIHSALVEMGYETPSPIQAACIGSLLKGADVIGQAQTGTGKTAAFGIPVAQMINREEKGPQALIMCPTRELVIQVAGVFKKLCAHLPSIRVATIVGGQSMDRQITDLRHGAQIIIGTPGRLQDHINRRTLNPATIRMVVLDEADEMLDRGFLEDIENILKSVPDARQTILFSATIPPSIMELTQRYQKNPEHIATSPDQVVGLTVEQGYYEITEGSKIPLLIQLLLVQQPKLALVFCKTKVRAAEVAEQLQAKGIFTDA